MKNKVVIITGASSGIGLACVKEFAQRGAKICMASRNIAKLNELEKELTSKGIEIMAIKTDVSVENDCKELIIKTIEKYKTIDVLINNAGISMRALFNELEIDVIRKVMDINFWGAVYCSKYALPYLLLSKGSVVGISSITGYVGLPGRTGYAASKFALNGFYETLRMENLKTGLHVMVVAPGFTSSDIRINALTKNGIPQGKTPREEEKMLMPEIVANCIAEGIKKRKRELILSFQGKITVWLNKFFPSLVDWLVYRHMANEPDSPFK
jgi:short-subunit dehydrogenase